MLVLLTVCALSDKGSDLVLHKWKLIIPLDEFHRSGNTGVTVYRVVVVLLDNCFLQFFRYFVSNLHK